MNQAIRFLQDDLSLYISNTEQMVASITKIINKSRFIVGNWFNHSNNMQNKQLI